MAQYGITNLAKNSFTEYEVNHGHIVFAQYSTDCNEHNESFTIVNGFEGNLNICKLARKTNATYT